jgi:hypothetical protein
MGSGPRVQGWGADRNLRAKIVAEHVLQRGTHIAILFRKQSEYFNKRYAKAVYKVEIRPGGARIRLRRIFRDV